MNNPRAKQMYEDIELLLDHGDPAEPLLNACYKAIKEFPEEERFWLLSSRILQKLERPEEALKDINQVLKYEPFNVDFNLHLFNVLIQQNQPQMIPRRINWLFDNGPSEMKVEIARFAKIAIETGLASKHELIDEVLIQILKLENQKA